MKKAGTLLLIALILTVNNCLSQSTLQPTIVQTPTNPELEDKSTVLTATDLKQNQIYFLIQDSLWTFDLKEESWKLEDRIDFNDHQPSDFQMGYDSTTNALLFWEESVGRVYEWKQGMDKPRRIDKSFTHRNQYGHGGIIHSSTGNIYAIGGYGLWTWKNYIARFKRDVIEWSIVTTNRQSPKPSPRTIEFIDYWNRDNSMYILGTNAPSKGYIDYDYIDRVNQQDLWKYDINNQSWDSLGSIQLDNITPINRGNSQVLQSINDESRTALNQQTGNWYLPIKDPKGADLALLQINLDQKVAHFIRDIQGDLTNSYRLIAITFDHIQDRLLLFVYRSYSNDKAAHPIDVLSIPSSELQKKFAKQANILSTPGPVQVPWSTLLWYVLGGIILGAIGYLIYENRRLKSNVSQGEIPAQPFRIDAGNRQIYSHGKDVTDYFQDKELALLILLAKHQQNGKQFVATEEIEHSLWNNQSNPDYVRRMRNKTIQSINEKVKEIDGNELSEDLIVGRKSPRDKRKMQYGLNDDIAITSG